MVECAEKTAAEINGIRLLQLVVCAGHPGTLCGQATRCAAAAADENKPGSKVLCYVVFD